jgi:hypothetical protein
MDDHSVPPEFLSDLQSMTQFATTMQKLRDAAEKNYALTLEPVQCRSLIWAMRLLKAGGEGDG